eukprot:353265-Chlamydomonas_euryale.AAC.2
MQRGDRSTSSKESPYCAIHWCCRNGAHLFASSMRVLHVLSANQPRRLLPGTVKQTQSASRRSVLPTAGGKAPTESTHVYTIAELQQLENGFVPRAKGAYLILQSTSRHSARKPKAWRKRAVVRTQAPRRSIRAQHRPTRSQTRLNKAKSHAGPNRVAQ